MNTFHYVRLKHMKLLEVNDYIKDYRSIVVFFIEENVYNYRENLFKSYVDKDFYFNPDKLTRVLKS